MTQVWTKYVEGMSKILRKNMSQAWAKYERDLNKVWTRHVKNFPLSPLCCVKNNCSTTKQGHTDHKNISSKIGPFGTYKSLEDIGIVC